MKTNILFFLEYEILMDLYIHINKNTHFFLKGKILIAVFFFNFSSRDSWSYLRCHHWTIRFAENRKKNYFLKCVPIRSLQSVIFFLSITRNVIEKICHAIRKKLVSITRNVTQKYLFWNVSNAIRFYFFSTTVNVTVRIRLDESTT